MYFANNRNLQGVIVSILTISILTIVKRLSSIDCDALFAFSDVSISYIFAMIGIWVIGFIFFSKTKCQIDVKIFFIALSLISSSAICRDIVLNFDNIQRDLKESICEKSTDDGMLCEMTNLSKQEYDYVMRDQLNLSVPTEANNISIYYYRDTFLGEYILSMSLEMPPYQKIDSINYSNWVISDSLENKKIKYTFYESRD